MVTRAKRVKDLAQEHVAPEQCAHYWIIEASRGPTSRGVCKLCGAEKEFLNKIPDYPPVTRRDRNPLELPAMRNVEFDEEQNSS